MSLIKADLLSGLCSSLAAKTQKICLFGGHSHHMWGVQSTVWCQNRPAFYLGLVCGSLGAVMWTWETRKRQKTFPGKVGSQQLQQHQEWLTLEKGDYISVLPPQRLKGTKWRRHWKCDSRTWNTAGVNRSHISAIFTPQQLTSLITSPSLDQGVLISEETLFALCRTLWGPGLSWILYMCTELHEYFFQLSYEFRKNQENAYNWITASYTHFTADCWAGKSVTYHIRSHTCSTHCTTLAGSATFSGLWPNF